MCSICLEENDEKYIYTKEEYYSIQCKCNIYVHDDCMQLWVNKTKKCPICLNPLSTCNNELENKIRDELKKLYSFEILIILILVQIYIILYKSNPYNILLSLFILTILLFMIY